MTSVLPRRRRASRRAPLLWTAVIVAIAAALVVLAFVPLGRAQSSSTGTLIGLPAPTLEGVDLDGRRWALTDVHDRLIWINFWATWCPPCRTEMPMMERLAQAYGDRLLVVGVDFGEELRAVNEFVDRYGITYPILLDPDLENFFRWSPQFGLPRHYFVDANGTVVYEVLGELDPQQMAGVLADLLDPVDAAP